MFTQDYFLAAKTNGVGGDLISIAILPAAGWEEDGIYLEAPRPAQFVEPHVAKALVCNARTLQEIQNELLAEIEQYNRVTIVTHDPQAAAAFLSLMPETTNYIGLPEIRVLVDTAIHPGERDDSWNEVVALQTEALK